jgi:hypothetical protein
MTNGHVEIGRHFILDISVLRLPSGLGRSLRAGTPPNLAWRRFGSNQWSTIAAFLTRGPHPGRTARACTDSRGAPDVLEKPLARQVFSNPPLLRHERAEVMVGSTAPMRPPNHAAIAPIKTAMAPKSAPRDTVFVAASAAAVACLLASSIACRYCCSCCTMFDRACSIGMFCAFDRLGGTLARILLLLRVSRDKGRYRSNRCITQRRGDHSRRSHLAPTARWQRRLARLSAPSSQEFGPSRSQCRPGF